MPTKHIIKSYGAPAYYHIYNRASGERPLFRDTADRAYFISLLKMHLSETEEPDNAPEPIKKYPVAIVAYCLMGTHFHLLLFQHDDPGAISGFMRSVGTKYSMYYNKKYRSKGHVFQSSFRASHINNDAYLAHVTRYIHLNPRYHRTWRWSSYRDYIAERRHSWVHPEHVINNPVQYKTFVEDYAETDLRAIKTQLSPYLAN